VLGRKEVDAEQPPIDCVIYDMHTSEYYRVDGNTRYAKRRQLLPKYDLAGKQHDTLAHPIRELEGFYVPNLLTVDKLKSAWYTHIINDNKEGFVLLDPWAEVPWDKTFTKLKPLIDIDCVVVGYNEGTKGTKNEGKCGSLTVGVYKGDELVVVGKVPHMTDKEREVWTERMLFGIDCACDKRVIQVECSEITSSGKLRFPNYVRERADKKPKECTWDQFC
jgi:hypothetical protein